MVGDQFLPRDIIPHKRNAQLLRIAETHRCYQFVVDMYAKIESERLLYIRLNQTKLRSEQYIHLRDAVINDGNTTNV